MSTKLRVANIYPNDVIDGEGICVSLWVQGCPFHCKGCHNPQTWDFDGGAEYDTRDLSSLLLKYINADGLLRNFSVLGGEPLCDANAKAVSMVISTVKLMLPMIKVYVWTGYQIEVLEQKKDPYINSILNNSDYLIDGPYIEAMRDITLNLRGSSNQRVIDLKQRYSNE